MSTIPAHLINNRTLDAVLQIQRSGNMQGASEEAQMLWEYLQLFGCPIMLGGFFDISILTGSLLHRWVVRSGIEIARGHTGQKHYDTETPEVIVWVLDPTPENYNVCCDRRYYLYMAVHNVQAKQAITAVVSLAGSIAVAYNAIDSFVGARSVGEDAERARCCLLTYMAPWLPEPTDPGIPDAPKD